MRRAKRKRVHFYIDETLLQQLERFVERYKITRSAAVSLILSIYFYGGDAFSRQELCQMRGTYGE